MVTIEDAKAYLRIDEYESDSMTDSNVLRAMGAGHARMLGAVGSDVETYLPEDPRIDQLCHYVNVAYYGFYHSTSLCHMSRIPVDAHNVMSLSVLYSD